MAECCKYGYKSLSVETIAERECLFNVNRGLSNTWGLFTHWKMTFIFWQTSLNKREVFGVLRPTKVLSAKTITRGVAATLYSIPISRFGWTTNFSQMAIGPRDAAHTIGMPTIFWIMVFKTFPADPFFTLSAKANNQKICGQDKICLGWLASKNNGGQLAEFSQKILSISWSHEWVVSLESV
jgi:hypothetical protein